MSNVSPEFTVDEPASPCVRLENWSVVSNCSSPYIPPEAQWSFLSGRVYGHHRFTDGEKVTTSRMVKIEGNLITTSKGTIYKLGEPKPEYIEWCEVNGHHIPTEKEPIKTFGEN